MNKAVAAAALTASLLAGGAVGAVVFGGGAAGAQTGTQTPTPDDSGAPPTWQSNEDPAHEATESAEREAAEDNGTAFGHGDHHGWNEDPAHEATESAEREAAEDNGTAFGTGGATTTPGASLSS